jgi:hypothetical protein
VLVAIAVRSFLQGNPYGVALAGVGALFLWKVNAPRA